jgi:hypothetical protein
MRLGSERGRVQFRLFPELGTTRRGNETEQTTHFSGLQLAFSVLTPRQGSLPQRRQQRELPGRFAPRPPFACSVLQPHRGLFLAARKGSRHLRKLNLDVSNLAQTGYPIAVILYSPECVLKSCGG